MAVYLLDTNHASPLVTLHHPLRKRVLAAMNVGDQFAVCAPVETEVWYGISVIKRAVQNRAEWRRLRQSMPCYQIDEVDAEAAAELQLMLRLQGKQLETVDALVAAIAIRYNLILLTTDRDFRPITQLKSENWL